MLRTIIKTIIGWVKELWELLKVISDITPDKSTAPVHSPVTKTNPRRNALHGWRSAERVTEVARHRYIEVDGYAENFRIDRLGRYDLLQIEQFCENLVFITPDDVDEFIDESINYKRSIIDGEDVLWVPKDDCIEFAYQHHSALADVL